MSKSDVKIVCFTVKCNGGAELNVTQFIQKHEVGQRDGVKCSRFHLTEIRMLEIFSIPVKPLMPKTIPGSKWELGKHTPLGVGVAFWKILAPPLKSIEYREISRLVTGRNEVGAKVMFLLVSVILLTPKKMATVADGTHPTGMHSCCTFFYRKL